MNNNERNKAIGAILLQCNIAQYWVSTFSGRRRRIVDIRLRPRCAIHHPYRPHRLRPEIFRILFALAWHTKWMRLPMRLNGPDNTQNCPFPRGSASRRRRTHSQHAQKIGKDRAFGRYARGQTDAHRDTYTNRRACYNTSPPLSRAK